MNKLSLKDIKNALLKYDLTLVSNYTSSAKQISVRCMTCDFLFNV
jgi:hypothetical protein